jgi:chromosome partitioning protein
MATKIVAIAQQKGGAGKTTIAAQLAVTWVRQGYRVAMLDVDPQGSLMAWYRLRQDGDPGESPYAAAVPGWKLASEIDRLAPQYDVLVIDTPPHAETDTRVSVRAATLILVPIQPSPLDFWAPPPTLDLARKEKTKALLVLNRLPTRGKIIDSILARIAAEQMPLATATLGNRSAFASSMMNGKAVVETQPKGLAAAEIMALATEIGAVLTLPAPTD